MTATLPSPPFFLRKKRGAFERRGLTRIRSEKSVILGQRKEKAEEEAKNTAEAVKKAGDRGAGQLKKAGSWK
ncbi:MAG: hypothetical protein ACUVUE_02620, partial [Candidatus Bathycorpusculaceae bacterium]